MSEAEGKPDVPQAWPEGLGVARTGHSTPNLNPPPYSPKLVSTFPEVRSSATIRPSLRSHLGNVG